MKFLKCLKIFVISLFIVGLIFVSTVLIMASQHNKSFSEEIKSWGGSQQEKVVEDETTDLNVDETKVLMIR